MFIKQANIKIIQRYWVLLLKFSERVGGKALKVDFTPKRLFLPLSHLISKFYKVYSAD
jgi:hypothetical protein